MKWSFPIWFMALWPFFFYCTLHEKWKLPKDFAQNTEMGIDSYPKCKRSDAQSGGNTEVKKVAGEEVTIDNSWIVPIEQSWNVELCASIKCIKYVLKRVHKGADRATFRIQREGRIDENSNFIISRHIGNAKATWRIF